MVEKRGKVFTEVLHNNQTNMKHERLLKTYRVFHPKVQLLLKHVIETFNAENYSRSHRIIFRSLSKLLTFTC
jgi:hypothetical protein